MKRSAKWALFLVLTLLLTSVCCVFATAEAPAESSESTESSHAAPEKVTEVTNKISGYVNDIRAQFSVMKDKILGLLGEAAVYVSLGIVVLWLLECFFGYPLVKLQMFLAGAYIGFAIGMLGYVHLTVIAGVKLPGDYFEWIIAGLIAIICAFLFLFLNKAGLVLFATAFAYVKAATFTDNFIVQIIIAAVVLLLSIFFFKYAFCFAVSYFGGTQAVKVFFGITEFEFISKIDPARFFSGLSADRVHLFLGLLLAFLGVITQLCIAQAAKRKKRY